MFWTLLLTQPLYLSIAIVAFVVLLLGNLAKIRRRTRIERGLDRIIGRKLD
jgi:hypothetical protein